MSERTWKSKNFERRFRGFDLEVYEVGFSPYWCWTVARDGSVLLDGTAKRAWQAKLYARRAAERLSKNWRKP